MKDFILLFRQAGNEQPLLNDEEIARINKKWQDWIGDIEAQENYPTMVHDLKKPERY
ncbi:hypothetical protein KUH03_27455 [Sphingobacterium sp. E70]|uniref:hypothetical protein n=1 Tax=Sphingobacterium sp. E70 TaxID=2853439 RepID=UPI00211D0588|nr:hypothetical protein [Sphingobacterium sp. E70]ULT22977.1 hypothetical protein KUH03_27455 [Sphingobacterium sp. E70]